MEAPKQTDSAQPTPEQLLKLLELQMERERGKRAVRSRNRATFLVGGVLVILVAAGVALMVAQQLLAEMTAKGVIEPAPEEIQDAR